MRTLLSIRSTRPQLLLLACIIIFADDHIFCYVHSAPPAGTDHGLQDLHSGAFLSSESESEAWVLSFSQDIRHLKCVQSFPTLVALCIEIRTDLMLYKMKSNNIKLLIILYTMFYSIAIIINIAKEEASEESRQDERKRLLSTTDDTVESSLTRGH